MNSVLVVAVVYGETQHPLGLKGLDGIGVPMVASLAYIVVLEVK